MNQFEMIGKLLVVAGGLLLVLGGVIWLFSRVPILGRLPGDLRIEGSGVTCLIPLASSILLSILLTILLNVVLRLINR